MFKGLYKGAIPVAIKVLDGVAPESADTILKEIAMLHACRHPDIVQVPILNSVPWCPVAYVYRLQASSHVPSVEPDTPLTLPLSVLHGMQVLDSLRA